MLIEILENMGYHPKLVEGGDIIMRYQLKIIVFSHRKELDNYVCVDLESFLSVTEEDKFVAMTICNTLNRRLRRVKVFLEKDLKSISARYDFYFSDKESMALDVSKSLDILGNITCLYSEMKMQYIIESERENENGNENENENGQ